MERITSRQNPVIKEFRALVVPSRRQAAAGENGRILLDGAHLLEEAIESGVQIDVVAIRNDLADTAVGALARRAAARGARLISVSDAVLTAISPVRRPSGLAAIARHTTQALDAAFERAPQLVLMLSEIQDPGNVGAIVRVADACGATGVVTSEGTADPFGWKALRGSMGSTFHIPVVPKQSLETVAQVAKRLNVRLFAAVPRDGTPLPLCDLRSGTAVLLGSEGAGLTRGLLGLSDEPVTIPIRPGVESLNVATAAALIVYEAQRQRQAAGS